MSSCIHRMGEPDGENSTSLFSDEAPLMNFALHDQVISSLPLDYDSPSPSLSQPLNYTNLSVDPNR